MITCECGVQFPYPELREVVCHNGRHAMGYYQLSLIGPADYMESAPCPCPCHLAQGNGAEPVDALGVK